MAQPSDATADEVHEAYSFACLKCGHGWEATFQIRHERETDGHVGVHYFREGLPVPSPLNKPNCPNCGHGVVRILRAGRIADTARHFSQHSAGARLEDQPAYQRRVREFEAALAAGAAMHRGDARRARPGHGETLVNGPIEVTHWHLPQWMHLHVPHHLPHLHHRSS